MLCRVQAETVQTALSLVQITLKVLESKNHSFIFIFYFFPHDFSDFFFFFFFFFLPKIFCNENGFKRLSIIPNIFESVSKCLSVYISSEPSPPKGRCGIDSIS